MRHRDNEQRHRQNSRNDEPLREVFDFQLRGLLLGAKSIRGACDHRCAKAGLLDNAYDFVCGNTTRGCDDTRAAGRKVHGRGDDTGCSSELTLDAARAGSTGHPGDV